MDAEAPKKTEFAPEDLKLYVYGSRESDQFWLPSSNSHSRKPLCLTDIEKFTFNKDQGDDQPGAQDQKQPIPNPLFNQLVYKVACGSIHSIVLTTDGRVFTFGCNDEGALGRKGIECIPLQVQLEDPINLIAAGDNHSLFANSQNGAIYFTGNYNYKRGEMMTSSVFEPTRIYARQINVNNKNKPIIKLACGANHSSILINQKIFSRGEPEASTTGRRVSKRHKVENSLTFNGVNLSNVIDIECGGYHTIATCLVKKQKRYFAWGTNDHGQLGIGSFESQPYPVQIKKLRGKDIVQIAAGASFTLFLDSEGELYGCGNNQDSNLGLGDDFEYVSQSSESEEQEKPQQQDKKHENQKPAQAGKSQMAQQGIPKITKPQEISLPVEKTQEMKNQASEQKQTPNKVQEPTPQKQHKQEVQTNKSYIKSVVKIPMQEKVTRIGAGQNFGFAWNKQNLYTWGMGYGYVLLNGQENDETEPFKVKSKIINNHTIHELDAGNQHVLYTSYPDSIEKSTVKVEPRPSVWQNLSVAKHGLKRKK